MPTQSLPATPVLLAFVLGTFAGYTQEFSNWFYIIFLWMSLPLIFRNNRYSYSEIVVLSLAFLGLGIANSQLDLKERKNHYSRIIHANTPHKIKLSLDVPLRSGKSYTQRFYAKVLQIDNQQVTGKVVVEIVTDSLSSPFQLGDVIASVGQFKVILPPSNPGAFDYKYYLFTQHITHQIKLFKQTTTQTGITQNIFVRCRAFLQKRLYESSLSLPSKQLLNTLLLGDRSQLDKGLIDRYASVGVVHILAISGLHIGLLMLLFRYIFSPLKRLPKGTVYYAIVPLLLLWCYAFVVGASASVIRAVTLFSAWQLSSFLRRRYPPTYLVLLSMVVLLFAHPRYILHLGFQMSYLAVFGILIFQPLFQRPFHQPWSRKIAAWVTVPLAAQGGVTLLSCYYFHQFPGLFLIANIPLLAILSLLLYLSLTVLIILTVTPAPLFLVKIIDQINGLMNAFISLLSEQDDFIIEGLFLKPAEVFWSYMLLAGIAFYFTKRRYVGMCVLSVALAGLLSFTIYESIYCRTEGWVGHHYGATILTLTSKSWVVHYTTKKDKISTAYQTAYLNYAGTKQQDFEPLKKAFEYKNKALIVIDNQWVTSIDVPQGAVIVLSKNPKINLERLLHKTCPTMVVIDGSNRPFFVQKWKETLIQNAQAFHDTAKQGAYLIFRENEE